MLYNVTDDDKGGPLDDFTEGDFEEWILTGLKQYLFQGRGVGAFPQIAATLARADFYRMGFAMRTETYLQRQRRFSSMASEQTRKAAERIRRAAVWMVET